MRLLYDAYRCQFKEPSKADLARWSKEYDALLDVMSADFRDFAVDGVFARVYLEGEDLLIESEACGGAVQRVKNKKTGKVKRLPFDPHYEVMTVAVVDAKRHMWS